MPLPGLAPGVAAGVAGVTPLPVAAAFPPCCWPFTIPFAPWPSFSEEGGVRSPAPPGKDSEFGDVKALACCAVDGWVVSDSIVTCEDTQAVEQTQSLVILWWPGEGSLQGECKVRSRTFVCPRVRSEGWGISAINRQAVSMGLGCPRGCPQ